MNEISLIELINAQSEGLNRGEDIESRLLAQYADLDPADIAQAAKMFQLAKMLKSTLTPVAPNAAFRDRLRTELIQQGSTEIYLRPPSYKPGMAWLWVAAAGSIVSFFGVILLLFRRLRNGGSQETRPATTTI